MRHVHQVSFQGLGIFPLDMLRYDRCWPAGPSDVAMVGYEINDLRVVSVRAYSENKNMPFTEARWASFGWHLIKTSHRVL